MNEQLIDWIVSEIMNNETWEYEETITEILQEHLSDKLILDKKVLDDLIEKYEKRIRERNAPVYSMVEERMQDLQSLLPTNSDAETN